MIHNRGCLPRHRRARGSQDARVIQCHAVSRSVAHADSLISALPRQGAVVQGRSAHKVPSRPGNRHVTASSPISCRSVRCAGPNSSVSQREQPRLMAYQWLTGAKRCACYRVPLKHDRYIERCGFQDLEGSCPLSAEVSMGPDWPRSSSDCRFARARCGRWEACQMTRGNIVEIWRRSASGHPYRQIATAYILP